MKSLITLLSIAALFACVSVPQPQAPRPDPVSEEDPAYSIEDEAVVLRLEDRREFDAEMAGTWSRSSNAERRARLALALGRVGEATFDDRDGDGEKDDDEPMAGVEILRSLSTDPDSDVRLNAAFALGEIGDTSAAPTLMKLATDPIVDVAAEAVEALSKLSASVGVDDYLELTQAPIPTEARARAIRFLFRFEDDRALEAATGLLATRDSKLRLEAAYVFARRAHAPAREALERLASSDSNPELRAYAVRGLGRIADLASLDTLLTAANDPHSWVRVNSANAIAAIASQYPDGLDRSRLREDAKVIVERTEDPDAGVTVSMIQALGHFALVDEASKARLFDLARSSNRPWFREVALGTAITHFGETDWQEIEPLLEGGRPRWMKIEALQASGALPIAGARLRKRFASDSDASVRATAVGMIPEDSIGDESAIIEAAIEDDDPVVRANATAAYAILATHDDRRLTVLIGLEERGRTDSMNDARLAAIRQIATIPFDDREGFLRGLLDDSDSVVRRTAADLIEQNLELPRPQYTPLGSTRPNREYREIAAWAFESHTATIHAATGDMKLVLMTREAPLTTWNFAQLARSGYYDQTSFMRVVPNFVIQGGDPRNDMSGGPGWAIRDEMNTLKYSRAAVGMALSGPDTGGSQFFVTHSPQHHLDGGYTIFGRVFDGLSSSLDELNRADPVASIGIDEFVAEPDLDIHKGAKLPLPLEIGFLSPEFFLETIPEYADRKNDYMPDEDVLDLIALSVRPGDRMEVVMGTWCSDSQREVPKYLRILDALRDVYGVEIPTTWVAVDRSKTRPEDAIAGKEIQKVATFIYYRDNHETGRIVETPMSLFEDDLLALIAGGS